jgi:uncharacterized protein YcgI (DUF1989 family)
VNEIVVPRGQAVAFEVQAGQTVRIIAHEGKQVADLFACARDDHRERFSSHATASASRNLRAAPVLYAGPPTFDPLLTVTHDAHEVHWIHGRCSPLSNRLRGRPADQPTCHSNIVEALAPYGLTEYEVPLDTFNVFMNPIIDASGTYRFQAPVIDAGDRFDLRAEKDLLVSISACPQASEVNDHVPKAVKVQVLGPAEADADSDAA